MGGLNLHLSQLAVPAQTTPASRAPPSSRFLKGVGGRCWGAGGEGVSSTKFPRRGLQKVIHHRRAPGDSGFDIGGVGTPAVGGRGRLARPRLASLSHL